MEEAFCLSGGQEKEPHQERITLSTRKSCSILYKATTRENVLDPRKRHSRWTDLIFREPERAALMVAKYRNAAEDLSEPTCR